jgi:hypothetical protein
MKVPSRAKPSRAEPSRAELGHLNFRAETEMKFFKVKSMPPSLSELKVTQSFCFAFKIPDDVTASNTHYSVVMNREVIVAYFSYKDRVSK